MGCGLSFGLEGCGGLQAGQAEEKAIGPRTALATKEGDVSAVSLQTLSLPGPIPHSIASAAAEAQITGMRSRGASKTYSWSAFLLRLPPRPGSGRDRPALRAERFSFGPVARGPHGVTGSVTGKVRKRIATPSQASPTEGRQSASPAPPGLERAPRTDGAALCRGWRSGIPLD